MWEVEYPLSLGRDHTPNEVVDLEVRAELPGGGESRWIYSVRLRAARVCDVVVPAQERLLAAFGSTLPLNTVYDGVGECVFNLGGAGHGTGHAHLTIERAPAMYSSVAMYAKGYEGARSPAPELGETAVFVDDPHPQEPLVFPIEAGDRAVKVEFDLSLFRACAIFEFDGRIWAVVASWDFADKGLASRAAVVAPALILRDLLVVAQKQSP